MLVLTISEVIIRHI